MMHLLVPRRSEILFLACYFVSLTAFAQFDTYSADSLKANQSKADSKDAYHDKIHIYILPQVAVPVGELRDVIQNSYGNVGIGIAAGAVFNPFGSKKPSPVLVGLDFGYLIYGVDKIPANATHGNIKSSFNIYSIGLAGRLLANQHGRFTPFLDGVIGGRIFNVLTKIDKNLISTLVNSEPEVIDSYDNISLNYSVGVGFFNRHPGSHFGRGSFSVRLLYSWGLETRYVLRNSVYMDANSVVHYQTANTQTNMFIIQLGLQLY